MYYKKHSIIIVQVNRNHMDNDELNMVTPTSNVDIVLPQSPTTGDNNELQSMSNNGEVLPGNTTQYDMT